MIRSLRSRLLIAVLTGVGFGWAASPVSAQVTLYAATFDAPTYTDGPLNSNTDTTTPGQDGWITTSAGGATVTNPISVSNSATNGFVSLSTSGQDVRRPFTAVTSGSVFFDADINVSAAQATGDYALHFTDGGTGLFYARTYFKSSGSGFVMAEGTSSGTTGLNYGTTVLNFGQAYHLLVRYDFVSGTTNDTGAIYINPTSMDGSADTSYVPATLEGIDATSIAAIAMRQGTAANAPTLTVDNLRVFSEAAVPEPSTFALLGVAGVAALVRRRANI
jgi:hypothetical protein